MASAGIEGGLQEDPHALNPNGFKAKVNGSIQISTSQKALLRNESHEIRKYSMLTLLADRFKLQKFIPNGSLASPAKFQHISKERDELSHSVPSSACEALRKSFSRLLYRKIDWRSLKKSCKNWIKNPLNMVLLLWIICVAVSGAILFLVMTGMLNKVLTKKSQRDACFEVNNQILNALFTLMCLYQHPKRFYHLVLLLRWSQKDVSTLRKLYCKNNTCKPHEWAHMMVVVVLLHVNCFAQYALCALNLGFKRSERPVAGVGITLSIAIAAPALAGVYSIVSPLGKDYETDEEAAQNQIPGSSSKRVSLGKKFSFASRSEQSFVEHTPQWKGGLFDLSDNLSVAYLSLFCSFCVFGWNMEKLGFGNKYVHIATFILFCIAPFWIFNLAAINIDGENVRTALGLMGVVLCLFGLLYGGFWRIQIRKRFNLPPNKLCCGKPAVADCIQWLFCCWCSLAQEVRTADFYDIVDDKFFCKKQNNECAEPALNSLPHEEKATQFRSMSGSSLWSSPRLPKILSERSPSSGESKDIMEPPIPMSIDIEDNGTKRT
ncbi:hypothetical protein L6164_002438 [Bauhinia variegata]|uniref:Uncharacterized protein n=1 Tax=Bauhinia variegata TaxID=167791 RepID=A0ACB9Q0D5_BAUVA|nr:hypothetical protein L6164_002438 [Bauhinia variegata]